MFLTATGLGHCFPACPLLFQDLGFRLDEGDMVAVTGPSGSGKSTLLAILAGWIEPTEGRLDRAGIDTVTWVPQNSYGVPRRTVLDHAALALMARGIRRARAEAVARRALSDVGLGDTADRPFSALSGGEAQRLMLARASLSAADLVLSDEPTAQLDPTSAATVIAALGAITHSGRIVVIATHDPRVAAACSTTIRLGAAPTGPAPAAGPIGSSAGP